MKREIIEAEDVYVYPGLSSAIKINGLIFTSGQVPFNPDGQLVGAGDIKVQTRQIFENLSRILEAGGSSIKDIVKINYYVVDYRLMSEVSEVVQQFVMEPFPAALGVEVAKLGHPDLHEAQKSFSGIIAFTGVDFPRSENLDEKFAQAIEMGPERLKLHLNIYTRNSLGG